MSRIEDLEELLKDINFEAQINLVPSCYVDKPIRMSGNTWVVPALKFEELQTLLEEPLDLGAILEAFKRCGF